MKIRALRLAEVGPFRDPVAIEGFSGGLDVLAGPNELGKSTLFRAIRAVFLTRHSTMGRIVEEMSTRGGGRSPRIEADFEAQGQLWRITKTYGRGKSAELLDVDGGRVRARGPDAEGMLSELIGIGSGDEAAGRLSLLWVGQQQSLSVPTPDGDAETRKHFGGGERATLEGAIAREVDTVTGGAMARLLSDRVIGELNTYMQPKRGLPKKGSRYDTAIHKRIQSIEKRDHLRAEQTKAADRLDKLEALMRQQASEAGPQRLAGLGSVSDAAEKSLKDAEQLASALAHVLSREETARHVHEKSAKQLLDFGQALEEVRIKGSETAELKEEQSRTEEAHKRYSAEIAHIDEQIGVIESRIARLARDSERARQVKELGNRITANVDKLARANDLQLDIARIDALLAGNPATPERMRQLVQAEQAAVLAGERAAQPANVDLAFSLDADVLQRVRINSEPVRQSGRIGVDRILTIEIEGIGRFEIIPADADERVARRDEADKAQARLADIEAVLGVQGPQAAQSLAGERQSLGESLTQAKMQLQALVPDGVSALDLTIEADRQRLTDLERLMEQDLPRSGGEPSATELAGITSGEIDTDAIHRGLTAEAGVLRSRRDEAMEELRRQKFALQRIAERRDDIAKRLAECDALLGPEAGRMGERDRLAASRDTASAALNTVMQERAVLSQSAPTDEQVRALRDKASAANAAKRQAEVLSQRLGQEIATLEGEVRAAGESAIGPELQRLDGEIAALDAEIAHYEHEVAALELLRDTLAAVAADNRSRFLVPVMNRLQPYLAQVFPGAEVMLGDDFGLQLLSRGGNREPIDVLSDGTREQLAVLVRLGFGRLIAETGTPAPLILDDALVFSDDDRIVRMFRSLQSASQHHQVIVFTCREATFAPLGGTRLKIEPWRAKS